MVKRENTLYQLFGKIHNNIYANEGLSPYEALNEFVKLLFIKLEIEKKFPSKANSFISDEEYNDINEGKENEFKTRMTDMFDKVKAEYEGIFDSNDSIKLKTQTIAFVIKNLQQVNFLEMEGDAKGAAFQKFIFSSMRGDRGQFLTPDPILELIVNFMKPTSEDTIIDPACGTGGFLIESLRYVKRNEKATLSNLFSNMFGLEISPFVLKLAKIRMVLEGDGHAGIVNTDGLSDIEKLKNLVSWKVKGGFDLVLTNPPFGTQGRISDKSSLKRFKFAHVWKRKNNSDFFATSDLQRNQTPEILFVERCIQLAKNGGRIAIVLPDGILENKTMSYIRSFLLDSLQILGVVSLPPKTFIPHGTGVKTSVLFMRKVEPEELERLKKEDYGIFFSIVENVGYVGNKNATPTFKKGTNGEEVLDEDITEIIESFNRFENGVAINESNLSFTRKISEIENRLDAEFYKPLYKNLIDDLKERGAVQLGELVAVKSKKAAILKKSSAWIDYVEITNVSSSTNEIVSSQRMLVKDSPSRASYEIKEGEVITAVAGVSTGTENQATAIVTKEFDGAICTNGFRVLIPNHIDKFYLAYYLKTEYFLSQVRRYLTGAAIPSIVEDDLKKIYVLIPSEEKEREISNAIRNAYKMREEARLLLKEATQNPLY